MEKFLIFILLAFISANISDERFYNHKYSKWNAEKFLTGKFVNNLGSKCNLIAKHGKLTGSYSSKPSRGTLVEKSFPISGVYTPVEDGVLLSFIVTFEMEGKNQQGLKKVSTATWNGKIFSNQKSFKMNWLLVSNQNDENEWYATNVGQDQFTKVK